MNKTLLKLHCESKKHKAKLQDMKLSKKSGDYSFKLHVDGKKHLVLQHAIVKEKRVQSKRNAKDGPICTHQLPVLSRHLAKLYKKMNYLSIFQKNSATCYDTCGVCAKVFTNL